MNLKLKKKILLCLSEFVTSHPMKVGWERRNVLRFVSMSVLWRTCSDSGFLNFPSSIQIKKRQQDVVRFLEANRIEFEEVDITMSEEKRQWMYKNIPEDRQPAQGNPLPPQIFSDDRYCGVSSCCASQYISVYTLCYIQYISTLYPMYQYTRVAI